MDIMAALYLSSADQGNEEVVRLPRPADALGAALRGVFSDQPLPVDMVLLLNRLDRVR